MFCSNCGTQVPDDSIKCTNCGSTVGNGSSPPAASPSVPGAVRGFFILLASFFTMPIKTFKLTGQLLREVGKAGSFNVGETSAPHLAWLRTACSVLACVVMVCIILWNLYAAIPSSAEWEYQTDRAALKLFGRPLLGVLFAIMADWLIMLQMELLSLWLVISNDIKKIADKS